MNSCFLQSVRLQQKRGSTSCGSPAHQPQQVNLVCMANVHYSQDLLPITFVIVTHTQCDNWLVVAYSQDLLPIYYVCNRQTLCQVVVRYIMHLKTLARGMNQILLYFA